MLKGGYVPDRPQRELKELLRYRRSLIRERTREINRIQKVLEGANIKLGDVASNVVGASGRAMLQAIAKGAEDPKALADLAKGRLRDKRSDLEKALHGLIGPHQRRILDEEITQLDEEVVHRMRLLRRLSSK